MSYFHLNKLQFENGVLHSASLESHLGQLSIRKTLLQLSDRNARVVVVPCVEISEEDLLRDPALQQKVNTIQDQCFRSLLIWPDESELHDNPAGTSANKVATTKSTLGIFPNARHILSRPDVTVKASPALVLLAEALSTVGLEPYKPFGIHLHTGCALTDSGSRARLYLSTFDAISAPIFQCPTSTTISISLDTQTGIPRSIGMWIDQIDHQVYLYTSGHLMAVKPDTAESGAVSTQGWCRVFHMTRADAK